MEEYLKLIIHSNFDKSFLIGTGLTGLAGVIRKKKYGRGKS